MENDAAPRCAAIYRVPLLRNVENGTGTVADESEGAYGTVHFSPKRKLMSHNNYATLQIILQKAPDPPLVFNMERFENNNNKLSNYRYNFSDHKIYLSFY
jgi:hypothetical protein